MKLVGTFVSISASLTWSDAFSIQHARAPTSLSSALGMSSSNNDAKTHLLSVCERLKSQSGVLIFEKSAKEEFKKAVANVEATYTLPVDYLDNFVGDWTLIATTVTSQEGIDKTMIPDAIRNPLEDLRTKIAGNANKYLKVVQRIRSVNSNDGKVNRVDHVLEYRPPGTLQDILDDLPEQLSGLNINPLQLSQSKIILAHKADVISTNPLVTKLTLNQVILNVAGTQAQLDPNGADVAALNLPEFISGAGDFTTTYMDDSIRISRGKLGGLVEQLRVFVRQQTFQRVNADVDDMVEDPAFADGDDGTTVVVVGDHDPAQDDVSPSDY
jgi:hypothetical protein